MMSEIICQRYNIPGLICITPHIHYDYRGEYIETWNQSVYNNVQNINFVQDDISTSKYGVLRGLHGDKETWKLIQCLKGEIFVVVVDCRTQSNNIPLIETFILNDKNRKQILIPPGCANGHMVLSDCIFSYKQSTYYKGADKQFTLLWNDPFLNINWPIKEPILSLRDKQGKPFKQIINESSNRNTKDDRNSY